VQAARDVRRKSWSCAICLALVGLHGIKGSGGGGCRPYEQVVVSRKRTLDKMRSWKPEKAKTAELVGGHSVEMQWTMVPAAATREKCRHRSRLIPPRCPEVSGRGRAEVPSGALLQLETARAQACPASGGSVVEEQHSLSKTSATIARQRRA
jgi:hypothetical protein